MDGGQLYGRSMAFPPRVGEDDPQITVLQVNVTEAQYWEASSSKLIYGMKYLAAAVTGGKVQVGESGRISL